MVQAIRFIVFLVVLSFICLNAQAENTQKITDVEQENSLHIAAFDIPNLLQADGQGIYDLALQRITAATKINFKVKVLPIARARIGYRQGQYDCLLPLDLHFEKIDGEHIQSPPFASAKLYAFTLAGHMPITNIAGLKGLRVAGELGVPFPKELNEIIAINKVSGLINLVRMLERGRFDVILAYTPDMTELMEQKIIRPLSYDLTKPLAIYQDSLTCRDTAENRRMMAIITQEIRSW